jgi:hypothetical protein
MLAKYRKQNYPQILLEIFIADAGCMNEAIKIVKNNAKVLINKLSE